MELHDFLASLQRRWVSILLITTLAAAIATAVNLVSTATYEAKSQVFVSVRTGGSATDLLQGSTFTQNRVKSYADMVTSPRVLTSVIDRLGLSTTPDRLAKSITADSPLDTVLINITVSDQSPRMARDIANATADSLGTQVDALEKPVGTQPSPVQVSTSRTATVPRVPATPRIKLNLALGVLLGLAIGVVQAVLREKLNTKVRSVTDVRMVSDAFVIGRIGYDDDAPQHPLIVESSPHSHRSEAFRRLRTNLQYLGLDDPPKSIVVTSSLSGEGKTTTAINLAMTLADSGSRVALVDADLRKPSIAEYMGLVGEVGLTTVLVGQVDLQDAMQAWEKSNLHVLPSGRVPPNASEILGSRSMANLIEQLTNGYDIVLIDAPPLLPVTDATILAKISGGAVVVVGVDLLHRQQFADGLGALEDVGARVLGVILNRLPHRKSGGSTRYYQYAATPGTEASRSGKQPSPSRQVPNETAETEREQVRASPTRKDDG